MRNVSTYVSISDGQVSNIFPAPLLCVFPLLLRPPDFDLPSLPHAVFSVVIVNRTWTRDAPFFFFFSLQVYDRGTMGGCVLRGSARSKAHEVPRCVRYLSHLTSPDGRSESRCDMTFFFFTLSSEAFQGHYRETHPQAQSRD